VIFGFNLFGEPSLLGVKYKYVILFVDPPAITVSLFGLHIHLWDGVPLYTVCSVVTNWLLQLLKCS